MEYFSFLNVILFQFTASVRVPALALPPSPENSRSNKPAVAAATQNTSASDKPAVAAATLSTSDSNKSPKKSRLPGSTLPGPKYAEFFCDPSLLKAKPPKAKRKIMQDPVEKVVKVAKVCQNTTYVIA